MTSTYSENNEDLQALWKKVNPDNEEYVQKEVAFEWIKSALENTNTLSNFQQSLTDLPGLIKMFLQQEHGINEQDTQNLQLSYSELVDFLNWLTKDQDKEQLQQEEQSPDNHLVAQNEVQPQKQDEKSDEHTNTKNKIIKSQPLQEEWQEAIQKLSPKIPNKSIVRSQRKFEPLPLQYQLQESQHIKQVKSEEKQDEDINQNATSNPNELNIQNLSKKYKEYLKVIFEHYCKISYATGQDPTFEQIKHKTTIMTINKYMIFCKEFEIAKINEVLNRNYLIQIFKKHSECYKQMSYQQFCDVIKKIASVGFGNSRQTQQSNEKRNSEVLSEQMVKMLEFCEIQTPKKFKQKMKKLNIQCRVGAKTKAEMKVIPEGYRFKFTSNNGKSQDQIKLELQERKQHRSQRKILLQQKGSSHSNEVSFRKRIVTKHDTSIHQKQQKIMKEINREPNSVRSTNAVNKILTPLPPPKRLNHLPPNIPKPSSNNPPSVGSQQSQGVANSSNGNLFKKDLGYAEMHKLKQTEGYSRKLGVNKSLSKQVNGNYKLNSIVEEARLEVQEMPQMQHYSDQLTQSIGTNSREEGMRAKNYDLNKINNKIQVINQRNRRDRQIQEQLEGLIDMSNDEDQFLKEHLEREKKNDILGKRLSQKINQLQAFK